MDSLHGIADLLRWCKDEGVIDGDAAVRLDYWAIRHPAEASAAFNAAVNLRESIYRVFFALASGELPVVRDVAAINSALERAPTRRTVAARDGGFGWRLDSDRRAAPSLLAPVLWSASDLLVSSEVGRVRHCANPKCLWLFLDDSKNGSRRWCSMESCGNRAKAHRHYLRRKEP